MLEHMPRIAQAKPRRRLDADVARALILDATEKRLVTVGPSGIRLQDVAADTGVSHSTVLHHFGSRELLVKAVIGRALRGIHANLVDALERSNGEPEALEAMLENVSNVLEQTGYARVVLWLALEGHHFDERDVPLSAVVDAAHAVRLGRKKHTKRPTREDTARTVVLATVAMCCGSVLTPSLLGNAGLGADAASQARFRSWFTRLLLSHIDQ
jgi:AcrR family transcriptional regulator